MFRCRRQYFCRVTGKFEKVFDSEDKANDTGTVYLEEIDAKISLIFI